MKRIAALLLLLSLSGLAMAQSQWEIIQSPTSPLIYSIDNVFFSYPQ